MCSSLSVIDGLKVNHLTGDIFEKVKIFHNEHNAFGLHQMIFSLKKRTDETNTDDKERTYARRSKFCLFRGDHKILSNGGL